MDQQKKFENLIIRQALDRDRRIGGLEDKVRAAIARHGRAAKLNQLLGNEEDFAEHARSAETLSLATHAIPCIHTN